MISPNSSMNIWKSQSANPKNHQPIHSTISPGSKTPKSILPIPKNTKSISRSNLEEAIPTKDFNSTFQTIEKYSVSNFYGEMINTKEGSTTFPLITSWLMELSRSKKSDSKIQVEIHSLFYSKNKNWLRFPFKHTTQVWAKFPNNTTDPKISQSVPISTSTEETVSFIAVTISPKAGIETTSEPNFNPLA